MIDYIHIFICIITAVVYLVISLLIGQNGEQTLFRLIFVIVISYAAGLMLKLYLKKNVFDQEEKEPEKEPDDVENTDTGEGFGEGEEEDEL